MTGSWIILPPSAFADTFLRCRFGRRLDCVPPAHGALMEGGQAPSLRGCGMPVADAFNSLRLHSQTPPSTREAKAPSMRGVRHAGGMRIAPTEPAGETLSTSVDWGSSSWEVKTLHVSDSGLNLLVNCSTDLLESSLDFQIGKADYC